MDDADRFWKEEVRGEPFRYLDSSIQNYHDWNLLIRDGQRELERIRLKTQLPVGENLRLYEIGCGAGRLLYPLSLQYEKVLGVDISEFYLNFAKEHLGQGNVKLALISEKRLPLIEPGTWDVVFSYQVLHYLRPNILLEYMANSFLLLKPGGLFIFQFDTDPIRLRTRISWGIRRVLHSLGIREWRGTSTSPGLFRHIGSDNTISTMLKNQSFSIDRVVDPSSPDTWFIARKPSMPPG